MLSTLFWEYMFSYNQRLYRTKGVEEIVQSNGRSNVHSVKGSCITISVSNLLDSLAVAPRDIHSMDLSTLKFDVIRDITSHYKPQCYIRAQINKAL